MIIRTWPLATITYTAEGLKDYGDGTRQAGTASLWRIKIHPDFTDDVGLLAHESEHVAQFWRAGLLAALALLLFGMESGAVAVGGLLVHPWWLIPGALFGAHPLLYLLVPAYRLWAEVVAYRLQAATRAGDGKDRLPLFAEFLAKRYRLDISQAEALRQLREAS